ncbi:MAG: hypothetical protein V3T22_12955 [Planctomycetota bacterium]
MREPTSLLLSLVALACVPLASCQIVPFGFGDAPAAPPVDWGPSDGGELTRAVLAPFFTSPELSRLTGAVQGPAGSIPPAGRIPVLTLGLLNGTRQPLDPELVMDSLRRAMLETGRFRFPPADRSQQQLAQEIRARPGGASADAGRVAAAGARAGAELALYASLSKPGKGRYRFTIEVLEVHTAERLWTATLDLGEDQLRRIVADG